jgi:hypothetical protein
VYSIPRSVVTELSLSLITNEGLYTVLLFSANCRGYKPLITRPLGEKLPNRVKLAAQFTHLTAILIFFVGSLNVSSRESKSS